MDWFTLAHGLDARGTAHTNQSSDPRIGSSRDNSTTGTLSHVTSSGTNSASAASLGSTFIPVLIYCVLCLTAFIIFRPKLQRVYAPRTIADIHRPPKTPIPPLPNGWFNWIKPFYQIDERFMLNNCSLDGFFFLRYLRILATICFAGCFIAWPVLLSVNATGGNKLSQLDLLTIGDVSEPIKFYAHVVIAWLFFGFILFMISRECIFYINLRQAYLMTPRQANRLSARTVLFTCVPKHFLDEHRLRKLYGDTVRNIWIPRNTRSLQRLVEERDKTAVRLEEAETKLIRKANAACRKQHGNLPLPFPLGIARRVLRKTDTNKSCSKDEADEKTDDVTSPASATLVRPSRSNTSTSKASQVSKTSKISKVSRTSDASQTSASSQLSSFTSSESSSSAASHPSVEQLASSSQPSIDLATEQSSHAAKKTSRIAIHAVAPCSDAVGLLDLAPNGEAAVHENTIADTPNASHNNAKISDPLTEMDDNEANYVHPYGFSDTLPDVRGSVAAQWLPAEARPTHRPLANLGRKVDTIRWSLMRLKSLNHSIARMRRRLRNGDGDLISSVFIEFDSQAAAQVAFQVLSHHQPLHMSPRFIGIRPEDVIWSSLRMRWWERIVRHFLAMGVVAAGIIFWSVPSAFVGVVSNVSFLSSNFVFLHWISKLPSPIIGVIQGLLPALALSLLMAAVPGLMRFCARSAGIPSTPLVELFTQNAYFGFQIVQVFLVTTLTSAASAAFTKVLEDPLYAKDMLSQSLPKASNFYLSYITVQCLAGGAMGMVHFIDLFRHGILAKSIQNPRRAVKIWQRLKQPHWGGIYPVFTNMGVIAISYACIAPLILVFAAVGMCCIYQVYKYNLLYTYDTDRDSKGLHYPRGLMQLMFGLYLAEICLIGLFSIQSAIGPVLMMVAFLIFTLLVHLSLNDAVHPLLFSLPRTLAMDDKDLAAGRQDLLDEQEAESSAISTGDGNNSRTNNVGLAADYYDIEEGYGDEPDPDDDLHAGPVSARGGISGVGDLLNLIQDWGRDTVKKKVKSEVKILTQEALAFSFASYLPSWAQRPKATQAHAVRGTNADADSVNTTQRPNFFARWLHPEIYEDYTFLRKKLMSEEMPLAELPPDYAKRGYWPPEMWRQMPRVWIPQDEACVSRQEVAHARKVVPTTDKGIWLTPKGRVVADLAQTPYIEPQFYY